jgi:hypothetical protein
LKNVLQKEKTKLKEFETLPFHYMEIASVLLDMYFNLLSLSPPLILYHFIPSSNNNDN